MSSEPDTLDKVEPSLSGLPTRGGAPAAPSPTGGATPRPAPRNGASALAEGQEIAHRYRVQRLIGHGGMGGVYRVYDRELDREVALKVILQHLAHDPTVLERFKREIQLSSRITHKNVLRVFDLGDADGMKYVTMQYVEGEDLSKLLKREAPLGPDRMVHLFRQMCRGLAAAHEQGVVHRDLKPQNVMVDRHDVAYVTDFGLARSLSQAEMTSAGTVLGTPHYMAPEQVKGQAVDRRADIYSLGLILYQMATGLVPFAEGNAYEIMMRRLHEPLRPVAEVNPTAPERLRHVIERCTALEPAARYQTAQEILRDLDAISPSRTQGLALVRQRRATMPLALASVAAVAVLAGGWFIRRSPQSASLAGTPQTLLIADFENRTGDPIFDGTIEPTFGLALEGAPFLSSFNRTQARKVAAQLQPGSTVLTEALARLVAAREGIGVVASGAIERSASTYALKVQAVDARNGRSIVVATVDASGKEAVLSAAAKLAARVRRALGDTTPESTQLAAAETFTASSLEAAHEYAVGQEMQAGGKWEDAIAAYSRAVSRDPDLGRAYAGMATVYANLGRRKDAEEQFDKALARIGRMSDRERLRTRGSYFLVRREPEKAVEQFQELVKQYPSDTAGLANLALAHFYKRDMAAALAEGRRAVSIYPKNVPQRNNVGLYAMYAGDFETAIREQQTVLEMNPSFVLGFVGLGLSQAAQGRIDEAARTYERLAGVDARGASMASAGLADLALYKGRVTEALEILTKGIAADVANKDPDGAAAKWIMSAEAHALAGRSPQAVASAARALELSRGEGVLFPAGRIYLGAGQAPKALALAGELAGRLEADAQAYGTLLMADVAMRRGDHRGAIALIDGARKKADLWMGRFDLGRAYVQIGAFAEAHAELEACLKRQGEATALFLDEMPTYRLLPAVYYYLGRAHEGLHDPAATESFGRYAAIRADAESDPLLAEARRRLGAAEGDKTPR